MLVWNCVEGIQLDSVIQSFPTELWHECLGYLIPFPDIIQKLCQTCHLFRAICLPEQYRIIILRGQKSIKVLLDIFQRFSNSTVLCTYPQTLVISRACNVKAGSTFELLACMSNIHRLKLEQANSDSILAPSIRALLSQIQQLDLHVGELHAVDIAKVSPGFSQMRALRLEAWCLLWGLQGGIHHIDTMKDQHESWGCEELVGSLYKTLEKLTVSLVNAASETFSFSGFQSLTSLTLLLYLGPPEQIHQWEDVLTQLSQQNSLSSLTVYFLITPNSGNDGPNLITHTCERENCYVLCKCITNEYQWSGWYTALGFQEWCELTWLNIGDMLRQPRQFPGLNRVRLHLIPFWGGGGLSFRDMQEIYQLLYSGIHGGICDPSLRFDFRNGDLKSANAVMIPERVLALAIKSLSDISALAFYNNDLETETGGHQEPTSQAMVRPNIAFIEAVNSWQRLILLSSLCVLTLLLDTSMPDLRRDEDDNGVEDANGKKLRRGRSRGSTQETSNKRPLDESQGAGKVNETTGNPETATKSKQFVGFRKPRQKPVLKKSQQMVVSSDSVDEEKDEEEKRPAKRIKFDKDTKSKPSYQHVETRDSSDSPSQDYTLTPKGKPGRSRPYVLLTPWARSQQVASLTKASNNDSDVEMSNLGDEERAEDSWLIAQVYILPSQFDGLFEDEDIYRANKPYRVEYQMEPPFPTRASPKSPLQPIQSPQGQHQHVILTQNGPSSETWNYRFEIPNIVRNDFKAGPLVNIGLAQDADRFLQILDPETNQYIRIPSGWWFPEFNTEERDMVCRYLQDKVVDHETSPECSDYHQPSNVSSDSDDSDADASVSHSRLHARGPKYPLGDSKALKVGPWMQLQNHIWVVEAMLRLRSFRPLERWSACLAMLWLVRLDK
ncbi:hypothetical protein C8J56DRAFT_1039060 [Mycena floridula]|nr:hypothetical protein C8J56DRAFT_1039060 [Mycena floridula]